MHLMPRGHVSQAATVHGSGTLFCSKGIKKKPLAQTYTKARHGTECGTFGQWKDRHNDVETSLASSIPFLANHGTCRGSSVTAALR